MLLRHVLTSMCLIKSIMAARILGLFPTPSISHQMVFRALTQELARRGHELVVLTTDPARHHPNITEIDAHDVSYTLWDELFLAKVLEAKGTGLLLDLSFYWLFFTEVIMKIFNAQLTLPEMQKLIKSDSDNFDLILVESLVRPALAIRYEFNAPLIAMNSFTGQVFTYEAMGIPTHPLHYPDCMGAQTPTLTPLAKIEAVSLYVAKLYIDYVALKSTNEILRSIFGKDNINVSDLEEHIGMLFLNTNPIWDGIKPTANVVYTWGSHINPRKELPKDLKIILDNSSCGVVYMSLGSNIKSAELSPGRLRVFVETFRRLPYHVLWKWEFDELLGKPDNVHISKWLPQADLLRHPNVKVFITQGGLQSTDEALRGGVPLVGIPFFADQKANVERYKKYGLGVALNIDTLTIEELEAAIKSVAEEEKYRAAVRRMSRLLVDEGVAGGVERAAWWVEYVIRHGGAQHMRSPAAGISAAEYFMIDVVAALAIAALIGLTLFVGAVYYLLSFSKRIRLRLLR